MQKMQSKKGSVSFNEIEATDLQNYQRYDLQNRKKAYLELNANALLMDKGKINLSLKARIFDTRIHLQ
jgi:hypothetical protein